MTDQAPEGEARAAANAPPLPATQSPSPTASMATDEEPPTGHVVTDAYAEAADPTGAVKATKQVPEPDSLGG
jgi:hypothetical protein